MSEPLELECVHPNCSFVTQKLPFDQAWKFLEFHCSQVHPAVKKERPIPVEQSTEVSNTACQYKFSLADES